jgi:hypothetical protein
MGLCFDDYLMRAVDRRGARIALDDSFTRGHLRTLIVRAITLPHPALRSARPAAIVGMRSEPFPQLRRVPLEARDALHRLRGERPLDRHCIGRRYRSTNVRAVASSFVARCAKSARVPLRCFAKLLGNFTPSMANISPLISPCASQMATTAPNT